jgi:hypothetical protein
MASLLDDQNTIARSVGAHGGRFLFYRCAALANIAASTTAHPRKQRLPTATRPDNAVSASGTSVRPTAAFPIHAPPRSSSQLPPDVEAVALKPPGHAEPNFASATVDATSGGITAQASEGRREECDICGRLFAADRIAKHAKVCAKANSGERKVFDMQEHRVRLTYADNNAEGDAERALRAANENPDDHKRSNSQKKRASWRQQSNALQNAMKSARGDGDAQQQEDLRVECSGCGRRFAPDTAETHIPKCIEKARNGRR